MYKWQIDLFILLFLLRCSVTVDSQEDREGEREAVSVLVEVTLVPPGVLHSDAGHPQHPGVQGLHPHRDPAGGDEHLLTNVPHCA